MYYIFLKNIKTVKQECEGKYREICTQRNESNLFARNYKVILVSDIKVDNKIIIITTDKK